MLRKPWSGPNFFSLDPDALYEIHIDNNGDGVEDITYQFRFKQSLQDLRVPVGNQLMSVPLVNIGSISAGNNSALNVRESYTVTQVRGPRRGDGLRQPLTIAGTSTSVFQKPVDNIGNKSLPDYNTYANQYIYSVAIPGCSGTGRVFVGQRKDSFAVNLGGTFDLVNIAAPATEFDPNAENKGLDSLANKNVTAAELGNAIRSACAGNMILSPEATQVLAQSVAQPQIPGEQLTEREREVLKCMVDGLNNNAIAERLVVSLGTVKFHISNIFHKLGVNSRVEAVKAAIEQKLV